MSANLKPVVLAAALAACTPALAQPAQARWRLEVLEPARFSGSRVLGLNASGEAVGHVFGEGGQTLAARWLASAPRVYLGPSVANALADTGTLVGGLTSGPALSWDALDNLTPLLPPAAEGSAAVLWGISPDGRVAVGQVSGGPQGTQAARHLASTGLRALAVPFGTVRSQARDVNNAGLVVGEATRPGLTQAITWDAAGRPSLLALPFAGAPNTSVARAVNAAGDIVGWGTDAGQQQALLWRSGQASVLAGLAEAADLNTQGDIVGSGFNDLAGGGTRAGAWLRSAQGVTTDLATLAVVRAAGFGALADATGLNDRLQLTANGTTALGQPLGLRLSLEAMVWESAGSGAWDSAGWSHGLAPTVAQHVAIDPLRSLSVTGPRGAAEVASLQVGGAPGGHTGVATLLLDGGPLRSAGRVQVTARGVLGGDGLLQAAEVVNHGTLLAGNLHVQAPLLNHGLVTGQGLLAAALDNAAGGTLRPGAGQRLVLQGSLSNQGLVELRQGAELDVQGPAVLQAGGRLVLSDGVLRSQALGVFGQVQVGFGRSEVFGRVTNFAGGQIVVSGRAELSFYDAVANDPGSELRVSAGATALFFGPVHQGTGALFSGTGTKYYEGGLSVGQSPGQVVDEGSVGFGAGNVFLAEIGATDHDHLTVQGGFTLGGTLRLTSWQGHVAQAGQAWDLFDWGTLAGRFDTIDASGLALAAGTRLDLARLYLDGTVAVQAVPEPTTWALWLLALGAATSTRSGAGQARRGPARPGAAPTRPEPGRAPAAR